MAAAENILIDSIYIGDARHVLAGLPDACVDCVVTSPPYYNLRDYGVDGQLGLESTPEEYVAAMVSVFREVRRVLRPTGTLWLNIADSYARASGGDNSRSDDARARIITGQRSVMDAGGYSEGSHRPPVRYKAKDLLGIPWLLAFALRADGWYLRSDIIWAKPNPMPESVKDRPTKSHEYVFLLSPSPSYWYNSTALAERTKPESFARAMHGRRDGHKYLEVPGQSLQGLHKPRADGDGYQLPEFRNARDVWSIVKESSSVAHFATMPVELVRRCILSGCPPGGVVLDPFFGSGTTGLVARSEGRHWLGVELNPEYVALARERLLQPYTAPMFVEDGGEITYEDELDNE